MADIKQPIVSVREYLLRRMREREPALPFPFNQPRECAAWQRRFRRAIRKNFGTMPTRVPLSPRITHREDRGDFVLEKVVYRSDPWMSVPAYVLVPKQSPFK